jgi:hypothetical protein
VRVSVMEIAYVRGDMEGCFCSDIFHLVQLKINLFSAFALCDWVVPIDFRRSGSFS